jgi:DNA repair exonuclease SbcCD ATPase subunit
MERLGRDLDQINMALSSLKERKVYLEGQIANVDTLAPVIQEEQGKKVLGVNPEEHLKALRLQLVSLQSSLSEKHPDIKKLKREIHGLETRLEESKSFSEEAKRLNDLKTQLITIKSRLGSQHPDVIKLSKEVAALSKEVEKDKTNKSTYGGLAYKNPENPAYSNLRTQIDTINLEMGQLIDGKNRVKEKMNYYQKRIENTPLIEKEYESLTTDYANAKEKYNEIMSKLMEAKVARGMEETQHGERFTIIDPAHKPEAPEKPDRQKIMLMGLFLSLGVGAGLAFIRENLDHSIKTVNELVSLSNIPLLASISLIEREEERKHRRKRIIIAVSSAIGIACVALIVFHFFVMPLDILWLKIQRNLMI